MDIKEPLHREDYKTDDDDNHHVQKRIFGNGGIILYSHDG
tara:strand:+ start:530 stop:649 length:120 start_codon:yes stop_codon:yes gene_type:complete